MRLVDFGTSDKREGSCVDNSGFCTFSELYTADYELHDLFAMRQTWRTGTLFRRDRPRGSNGLILLCGASGTYTDVSGASFTAHPDQVVFLPEGSRYAVLNLTDGADTPDAYLIEFRAVSDGKTLLFGDAPFVLPDVNTYLFRELAEKTVRAYEAALRSPGRLRGYVYELLALLGKQERTAYEQRFAPIAKGIECLENDPLNPISVEQLAAMCHVSSATFRKLFKEYAGKSPLNYRLELKLDAAKRMIDSENASFAYIAESLGFDSPAYFSRLFKIKTGFSPGEYRKRKRELP